MNNIKVIDRSKTNYNLRLDCDKTIKWYRRLWYLISNPFYYVFKGIIRW